MPIFNPPDPVYVYSPSGIIENGFTIHCPICDGENIHISMPATFEEGEGALTRDRRVRGRMIVIPLLCEGCQGWSGRLYVGFHKGETVIWVERLPKLIREDAKWPR